jgi:recombination protein RecR
MSVLHGPTRSDKLLCVVEESNNILPVEKTHTFNGRYHVLMGSLSPLKGITPDQLAITSLLHRLESQSVEEVLIATNPNVEGRRRHCTCRA